MSLAACRRPCYSHADVGKGPAKEAGKGPAGGETMKEFHIVFQQSRMVVFECSYYTLGNNASPYFSTSANMFIRSKRDYCQCGQAQNTLTKGYIRRFWRKWDAYHLQQLNDAQLKELANDLEELKQRYNYIEFTADKSPHEPTFYEVKRLSMQEVKNNR